MSTAWIIHRDRRKREALAQIASTSADCVLGEPTDARFETASAPDLVLLGLDDNLELELDFVHRIGPRLGRCAWILIPEASAQHEARRLFDTLIFQLFPFPPRPDVLRRALRAEFARVQGESLSRRALRERLATRFARWFGDLEIPELLRALNPQPSAMPLLIRGEQGTGRALLARYIHAFGDPLAGVFRQVVCSGVQSSAELLDQLSSSAPPGDNLPWTIWLEDVDQLNPTLQCQVRDWIELGVPDLPQTGFRPWRVRWICSASDANLDSGIPLDPRLDALISSGLVIHVPPLRERAFALESWVADTTLHWCTANGERPRRYSAEALERLRDYPWPGNYRELDAVIERSLAFSGADPLAGKDLRFEAGASRAALAHWERDGNGSGAEAVDETRPPVPPERELPPAAHEPASESSPRPTSAGSGESQRGEPEIWQRLVGAVAHEVRNPLVSIRTLAELLPERFEDQEFRSSFSKLVSSDVRRIERVVNQLQEMSGSSQRERLAVDLAGLLESLLDEHRGEIQARHLLVLNELDRSKPFALGDPQRLHNAFQGLISKMISLVPERGDVYVASHHHPAGLSGKPSVRVLLRYQHSTATGAGDRAAGDPTAALAEADVALDFISADASVRAEGGTFTMDTTDSQETVIVIDLPAPD